MKKRIIALVLCVLIIASLLPPYAYASTDYGSNVGKYAQLNSYYADSAVFIHDGSNNFAMTDVMVFDYAEFEEGLIFRITDWYLDSINSALWYQVEAYRGNLPADMPAGYWIFQRYTDDDSEEDTLLFVTVEPTQGETTVTVEGIPATEYTMDKYEKPLLEASSTLTGTVSYRWQILADREANLWVDIYGQDDSTLSLSYAMVKSLLNSENQAWVRCISSSGGQEAVGEPVCVTVCSSNEETPADEETELAEETDPTEETLPTEEPQMIEEPAKMKFKSTARVAPAAEGDELPEEPTEGEIETYILSILYVYGDESAYAGTAVAPAWSAEISPLQDYAAVIESPEFPGYTPDPKNVVWDYPAGTLKNDVQIVVSYNPAEVSYTVLHRWQNINDDQYSDYEIVTEYGETESFVPENLGKKDNGDPRYDGLEPLPYAIEAIAADSTTLIEVRHDRIYYLMTFNLDGGHGTYPIYARYETALTVPDPTRPGYTFQGWDKLDENGQGDGVADALPATMPNDNSSYKAIWTNTDTTYSVAYWIVNDDGTTTYLGSRTAAGMSGTLVSGDHDDLGTKANGGYAICGSEEHTHTDACYVCDTTAHKHTKEACFVDMALVSRDPSNGVNAIKDLEGGTPESGYIYVVTTAAGNRWPKLYVEDSNGNGDYYVINSVGDSTAATDEQLSSIIDGDPGDPIESKTGTYNGEELTTTKYRPKTSCNTIQHIHGNSCMICEEHTHSDRCYQDDKYLVDVDTITLKNNGEEVTYTTDTNVTIAGDGSAVVNVYYQFKEYTLKFYYAATTGGTATDNDKNAATYDSVKILGGTSYYFGSWGPDTSDDEELLEETYWDYSGQWGTVSALPTLNENGEDKEYTKGSVTYTRNNTQVQYHYISFKARYGDDISEMWPCAVFNSATRTTANTHGNWSGREAFVSAWNGEHHVRYSKVNSNQTIKGIYGPYLLGKLTNRCPAVGVSPQPVGN